MSRCPDAVDVLVIGAGPAGTTAAALLHRQGWSVCVVEREVFPRFVIGESLLPRCMDLLEEAGLLEAVRARGYLVKRGALFLDGDARSSFDFADQFTPGWDHTFQVPRADFDKTLADAVAARGVPICYRHTVTAVTLEPQPLVTLDSPDGPRQVRCRFVIDASGYGRVLPRLLGLERPSNQPLRQALFSHVTGDRRPPGPEEGRIWVCIHPQGAWIWIIPFADGRTSVGVVASPEFFSRFPGSDEACLRAAIASEPNAAGRLEHVRLEFPPRWIRGYSVAVQQVFGPGFCLVGNATEFLDPVFSSGVTLALESANRAAAAVSRALRGEAVDWQRDYADHLAQGVDTFRTYVDAWYDGTLPSIFFAPDPDPEIKRQICSVLAGYVWDLRNPFVRQHARKVAQLARIVASRGTGG